MYIVPMYNVSVHLVYMLQVYGAEHASIADTLTNIANLHKVCILILVVDVFV